MDKTIFQFSNVVVVDEDQIGVICKTRGASKNREIHYEIYVRSLNEIVEYDESNIQHYVFSKELSEDEKEWHG